MPRIGNLDYLVNAILALALAAAMLRASGVLARAWVAYSNAEWGLDWSDRVARRLRAGVVAAGLIFLAIAILNVLRL
jgi:predicted membrane-bound dolichyl-phosphate-mannose-protein mannosyltransferase